MKFRLWLLCTVLALPLAACRRSAAQEECAHCQPKSESTPATRHPLRGVVKEVNPTERWATVRHEEIPGFMKAMTMRFRLSAEDVAKIKAGDSITAQMGEEGDDWILEEVKIVTPAATP